MRDRILPTAALRSVCSSMVLGLVLLFGSGRMVAEPPNQPMTFAWGAGSDGADRVWAAGVITPETPAAFRNFAADPRTRSGVVVVLNSDGGDLEGGLGLGREFRLYGFDAEVGERGVGEALVEGRCSSACALAFLGGVERTLRSGSTFGVHQLSMTCVDRAATFADYPWLPLPGTQFCPKLEDGITAVQSAQGAVAAYINDMGVDARLLSEMAAVPPEEVRILETEELEALGIITTARN